MLRIAPKSRCSSLAAALFAGMSLATFAWHAAAGQNSRAGPVTGVIDGVAFEGDQYYVHGWACQEGNRGLISVNIYANHNYQPAAHLFVTTLWNQGSASWGLQGVYFTTSADFIHWSEPELAMTQNQMLRREPEGNWSYQYFSLIDL